MNHEFWPELLTQRILDVCRQGPQRIALDFAGRQLGFGELWQQSGALARVLGSGPPGPVALLLPTGPEAIIAMLAALRAGRIYCLLDTAFPRQRLQEMLSEVGPQQVLTTPEYQPWLRAWNQKLSCQLWHDLDLTKGDFSGPPPEPDCPAEIVFTTGSSGRPKGVLHTHRSILHCSWRLGRALQLGADDRVALLATLNSGQGRGVFFRSLLWGARLCHWPIRERALGGLAEWIQTRRISVLYTSATVFRAFARSLSGSENFDSLRLVRIGGERSSGDDARLFHERFGPRCQLVHGLASTEVGSISLFSVPAEVTIGPGPLSVGKPLEGVEIEVVDPQGQPVTPGVVGEVVIRSRSLPPGYWNQPEESAHRFRLDAQGRPAFFSGDRGSFDLQGNLFLCGRADRQVKVRGFRVELEEVEAALGSIPGVVQAACCLDESHDRLVAYVVAPGRTGAQLRAALMQRIPESAVPSLWILLESLPLQSNGKVDMSALPPPESRRFEPQATPSRGLEQRLVGLFRSLLEVEQLKVEDDFFELGAHSLLTARLLVEVERDFGKRIPLGSFLACPSVGGLARLLEAESPPLEVNELFSRPDDFIWTSKPRTREPLQGRSRLIQACLGILPPWLRDPLLTSLSASLAVQRIAFQNQVALIRRFLDQVKPGAETSEVVARTLLVYLLDRYRLGPFAGSSKHDRIEIDALREARQRGAGVILVRTHDLAGPWFRALKLSDFRVGRIDWVLQQLPSRHRLDRPSLYTFQLKAASERLRRGQVVEIHGDGTHGTSQGIEFSFHGRQRRFFAGFAELAVLAEAQVYLVDCDLPTCRSARLKLVRLEVPASGDHSQRVRTLVGDSVDWLRGYWSRAPWMQPFWVMREHLT